MKQVLIFCEGVTDQIFIADCLESIFKAVTERNENKKNKKKLEIRFKHSNFKGKIIAVDGCSMLRKNEFLHTEMQDNKEEGGANIVIFDADYTEKENGNKGIAACRQRLNSIITSKNIEFDYYIWPNNESDGEIETLLRSLIPSNKEPIFQCIEDHQNCLKSLNIINLKYADLKTKIGFYLHTSNENSEVRKRDYKNSDFWNLNYKNNDSLKKFIAFMEAILV